MFSISFIDCVFLFPLNPRFVVACCLRSSCKNISVYLKLKIYCTNTLVSVLSPSFQFLIAAAFVTLFFSCYYSPCNYLHVWMYLFHFLSLIMSVRTAEPFFFHSCVNLAPSGRFGPRRKISSFRKARVVLIWVTRL